MKTQFKNTWKKSTQVRKQRKYRYNAPMHVRQKLIAVHLDPRLRTKVGKRAMPVRKGDEVKVLRGGKKGIKGKVSKVSLERLVVYVEGQTREKVSGTKVPIPFKPSNLMITDMNLDDKFRIKRLTGISIEKKSEVKAEKSLPEEKKAEKKEVKNGTPEKTSSS